MHAWSVHVYTFCVPSGFGGFAVVVNPGMYGVSIVCKSQKRCPRVTETLTIDAQGMLESLSDCIMMNVLNTLSFVEHNVVTGLYPRVWIAWWGSTVSKEAVSYILMWTRCSFRLLHIILMHGRTCDRVVLCNYILCSCMTYLYVIVWLVMHITNEMNHHNCVEFWCVEFWCVGK